MWTEAQYLPGVTMELLRALGQPTSASAEIDLATAATMPGAFVTNAAIGVRPVQLIDDTLYNAEAELIRDLREAYLAIPGDDL